MLAPAAEPITGLDPALLAKPPIDTWPTYHGDYSGRRYSTLRQIDTDQRQAPVPGLDLPRQHLSAGGRRVGGEGPETPPAGSGGFRPEIKSTPLLVNGVLYFTVPDHVWAVDARTGRELWHYYWRTKGGIHIGNRGVGMHGNWLYFLTPDNYFVSPGRAYRARSAGTTRSRTSSASTSRPRRRSWSAIT